MELYNPQEEQLAEVYVVEKIGTKEGWSNPSPDENFMFGYPQEIQDFMEAIAAGREPKSGMLAASDVVSVLYAGTFQRNVKELKLRYRSILRSKYKSL